MTFEEEQALFNRRAMGDVTMLTSLAIGMLAASAAESADPPRYLSRVLDHALEVMGQLPLPPGPPDQVGLYREEVMARLTNAVMSVRMERDGSA